MSFSFYQLLQEIFGNANLDMTLTYGVLIIENKNIDMFYNVIGNWYGPEYTV